LRKLPNKNKYICRIQDVKPKHCRDYPTSRKHAEDTGFKGFGQTK
jgi:Fe-S-cluster containining protein